MNFFTLNKIIRQPILIKEIIMDGIQTILADYDFPVQVMPLQALAGGMGEFQTRIDVPANMQRAIVRTDTGQVLGTHGGAYQMIRHGEVVDKMEQAARNSERLTRDFTHTQQVFENGAKMRGTIAFNDLVIEPQVGDYIKFHVDYTNSYDGAWSIMIKAEGYRLWCSNGCASPKALSFNRNKHTSGFSLQGTQAKIDRAISGFFDSQGIWREYATQPVSQLEAETFLKATICKRNTNTTQVKVNESKLEKLMGFYRNESIKLGQNKWALYNALTYWSSHARDANHPHRAEILRHSEVSKAIQTSRWDGLGVKELA
jgi:hypothetical protein